MGKPSKAALLDMAAQALEFADCHYWATRTQYAYGSRRWDGGTSGSLTLPRWRTYDARTAWTEREANAGADPVSMSLDADTMLATIRKVAAGEYGRRFGWDGKLPSRCADALRDPSGADFDSDDGDVLVQLTMLGSIVYG